MSNLITPRRPSGFNDYSPSDQIEFNRLLDIIRATYEKYGATPTDTPVLELSEVLLAKGGGETEQQVYRFERGKNDLTLRYDLTIPLARYVAEREGELAFPFTSYRIGKVYRAERAQAGRYREFYQCDIDTIGSSSPIIDAEFPAIISEIFEQFNFGEFVIRLNDRRILNEFFDSIGVANLSKEVLRIVDKIEKISPDELKNELEETGLSGEQINKVFDFVNITGSNDEVINSLQALGLASASFLERTVDGLRKLGVPESRFAIDLKIARGLDYYTGTVYETILVDYPQLGSVCSGGRYDNLAGNYTKTELTGIGISIGLSRLFYGLRELGVINPTRQTTADIMVAPMSEAQIPEALAAAAKFRAGGKSAILYTEPVNLKKIFRYADRIGVSSVALIGETEAANGTVALKDMTTGETTAITL